MNIKLKFEGKKQIKSIKFHKNGKVKKEKYYDSAIVEYNERGNMIHYKNSRGYEYWCEYDENGNCIHHKHSDGFEDWRGYDDNGKLIHYKDSNGFEEWNEYDENNNCIYRKVNNKVVLDKRNNKGEEYYGYKITI